MSLEVDYITILSEFKGFLHLILSIFKGLSIAESEEGIMKAEVILDSLSDERWRWIIQGKIEGQERDIQNVRSVSKELYVP